jgi:hypothetical protein
MAVTHFQRTVWSTKIQTQLETISGLKDHCDYQFEGEIKFAKEVKILGVTRPTIKTYVPGTPIEREGGTDESQLLKINQFRYFNIEVDDVDKAQSVKGLLDTLVSEAAKGLAEEADKYIASLTVDAEYMSDSYEISTSTIVQEIEKGFKQLYENNCKVTDTFHLEVTPAFFTALRPALTELYTNNVEMLKKGIVGKFNNAYVSISNLLHNDGTDDYCLLRTTKAIAFAGQIDKIEAYRPEDAFSDAVKGLYVFGAKIVRPEQLYVIKAHEAQSEEIEETDQEA